MKTVLLILALGLFTVGTVSADTLHGKCFTKSGAKCSKKVHQISTSWNSKKAYPEKGKYELDFGGSVGTKITIYCDGSKVGSVTVKGRTSYDIYCR